LQLTEVQGHRGARALFPENTLEGFLAAAALGVTTFELDVGLTLDGVVVVCHDPALNPDMTRDVAGAWLRGKGPLVRSLTYRELERFDVGRIRPLSRMAVLFPGQTAIDGARIPALSAVLAGLPDARFTIEVKTDPGHPGWTAAAQVIADATVAVIDAAGAVHRVVVESFDWRVQRHIRRTRPDIRLAWLTDAKTVRGSGLWWDGVASVQSVPGCVAAEGGPIWAPDHADLTKAQVREAHDLGLSVVPWTVNRGADLARLIGWGVDGLVTDRPDVALSMLG
jgi:glycerophosphoryl diester phosphodiesterase